MADQPDRFPRKGDEYQHATGPREVVYATVDGGILTVKEYPDERIFNSAMARASFVGINSEITSLPGPLQIDVDAPDAGADSTDD